MREGISLDVRWPTSDPPAKGSENADCAQVLTDALNSAGIELGGTSKGGSNECTELEITLNIGRRRRDDNAMTKRERLERERDQIEERLKEESL